MTILPREDPSRFAEELDRLESERRKEAFWRKYKDMHFLPRKKDRRKKRNEDSD